MTLGRCFRLEANKIWLRRRVKASEERSPASNPARSSGLKARTYMGGFHTLILAEVCPLHNRSSEPALAGVGLQTEGMNGAGGNGSVRRERLMRLHQLSFPSARVRKRPQWV